MTYRQLNLPFRQEELDEQEVGDKRTTRNLIAIGLAIPVALLGLSMSLSYVDFKTNVPKEYQTAEVFLNQYTRIHIRN